MGSSGTALPEGMGVSHSSTSDLKLVHFINDVFRQGTDVTTVGPMLLAGPAYHVGKAALLRNLMVKPGATRLARVLKLGVAPVLGGFAAETAVFSLGARALTHFLRGPVPWDLASVALDMGMAGLTLGLLKSAGFVGRRGMQWARGLDAIRPRPWTRGDRLAMFWAGQASGYLGLVGSHALQGGLFGHLHGPGGNIWVDALGAHIALNVGAYGGRSALGPRFHSLEQRLAMQAHHLYQEAKTQENPFESFGSAVPALEGVQGRVGGMEPSRWNGVGLLAMEILNNGGMSPFVLRDYQEEAAKNTLEAIRSGKGNGLIVLPTGTGKTVTFSEIAKRIADQELLGRDKKTLVLVHRVELVDQAKKAFEKVMGEGSVSVVSAGRDSREFGGKVVVAGVQTLVTEEMLKNLKPEEYGLVIVDETHHIVANTYRKILEHLGLIDENAIGTRAEGKFLLGVTATPDRSDGVHISVTFNDGLLFSKPILWFVHRDYLLRPQGVLVTTTARLSNVRVGASGDYIESELGAEMSKEKVLEEIVQAYEDIAPGQRALIFATSVDHAHALAEEFNKGLKRPRAASIDGTLDPDLRTDLIEKHKKGQLDILINYGVLTEGYDDPGIETIMVARPTRSRALYTQMIGRGLRPDPDHPERRQATIIDITGGITEHELDMDLGKLFGVDYVEPGLPPTDFVKMSEELGNVLKNPEVYEQIRKSGMEKKSLELEYINIALIQEASRPLPALLRKILTVKYGDDFSKMAWQLGMTEGRLTDYISGILPTRIDKVEKDFSHAPNALGISPEEILELWRQSRTEANLDIITSFARRLSSQQPSQSLEDFFPFLAHVWTHEAVVGRYSNEPHALLARRLWEWNRLGIDIQELEGILDRHDRSGYERSQAKADLQALTDLARKFSFGGDELIREARERGQIMIPEGKSLEDFLRLCQRKGLYVQELNTILNRNRIKRRGISDYGLFLRTMEEFIAADPKERGDLSQYYQQKMDIPPEDLPILLVRFLRAKVPVASRVKMLQGLEEIGILPDVSFADGLELLDGLAPLSRTPVGHLEHLLRKSGMVSPEYLAERLLPAYLNQLNLTGRKGKSFTKLKGIVGASPSEREGELKPGFFSFPRLDDEAIQGWIAQRLGTTPELWMQWAELEKKYYLGLNHLLDVGQVKHSLLSRLVVLSERIREEAREQGTELFYEDFVKRMGELTGLNTPDIEEWFDYQHSRVQRQLKLGNLPDTTDKIVIPGKRPSSQGQIWLQEAKKGQKLWSRIDGQRDKQNKIRKAVEAAGLDWKLVLKTVASWDPQTAKGAEKALIIILFDKKLGANFRRPK